MCIHSNSGVWVSRKGNQTYDKTPESPTRHAPGGCENGRKSIPTCVERGLDTDYAAMGSGQVHSDKFVEEIRRELRAGISWKNSACRETGKKLHKINLNTCSDSDRALPVETGGRPHCDMMDYFGTIQTGQTFRESMRRQMNRRHRRVFMTSTPIYASETGTNSVMEIERQANNGWVNATQSIADQFSVLGDGGPQDAHQAQENDESDNQQMSLAEKEQILAAGTSSTSSESETNNSEEE